MRTIKLGEQLPQHSVVWASWAKANPGAFGICISVDPVEFTGFYAHRCRNGTILPLSVWSLLALTKHLKVCKS